MPGRGVRSGVGARNGSEKLLCDFICFLEFENFVELRGYVHYVFLREKNVF